MISIGIFTMIHKSYRKKICVVLRDVISNKESEIYKLLLILDYVTETLFRIVFNIIHNFSTTYAQLDFSNGEKNVLEGMEILTRVIESENVSEIISFDKTLKKDNKKKKYNKLKPQSDEDMLDE